MSKDIMSEKQDTPVQNMDETVNSIFEFLSGNNDQNSETTIQNDVTINLDSPPVLNGNQQDLITSTSGRTTFVPKTLTNSEGKVPRPFHCVPESFMPPTYSIPRPYFCVPAPMTIDSPQVRYGKKRNSTVTGTNTSVHLNSDRFTVWNSQNEFQCVTPETLPGLTTINSELHVPSAALSIAHMPDNVPWPMRCAPTHLASDSVLRRPSKGMQQSHVNTIHTPSMSGGIFINAYTHPSMATSSIGCGNSTSSKKILYQDHCSTSNTPSVVENDRVTVNNLAVHMHTNDSCNSSPVLDQTFPKQGPTFMDSVSYNSRLTSNPSMHTETTSVMIKPYPAISKLVDVPTAPVDVKAAFFEENFPKGDDEGSHEVDDESSEIKMEDDTSENETDCSSFDDEHDINDIETDIEWDNDDTESKQETKRKSLHDTTDLSEQGLKKKFMEAGPVLKQCMHGPALSEKVNSSLGSQNNLFASKMSRKLYIKKRKREQNRRNGQVESVRHKNAAISKKLQEIDARISQISAVNKGPFSIDCICKYCNEIKKISIAFDWPKDIFVRLCCKKCEIQPKFVNVLGKGLTWKLRQSMGRRMAEIKSVVTKIGTKATVDGALAEHAPYLSSSKILRNDQNQLPESDGSSAKGSAAVDINTKEHPSEETDGFQKSDPPSLSTSDNEEDSVIQPIITDSAFSIDSRKILVPKSEFEKASHMVFENELKCKICNQETNYFADLMRHMWFNHDVRGCEPCKKTFIMHAQYANHMKLHKLADLAFCQSCKKPTDDILLHLSNHKVNFCVLCGRKTRKVRMMRMHIKRHWNLEERKRTFHCPHRPCDFDCETADYLLKHMWTYHEDQKCAFCEEQLSFDSLNEYLKHIVLSHSHLTDASIFSVPTGYSSLRYNQYAPKIVNSLPKVCKLCSFEFSDLSRLVKHQFLVHDMDSMQICGKEFLVPEQMSNHLRSQDILKGKCWLCGLTLSIEALAHHLKEHHSDKGCLVCFCQSESFIQHLIVHSNEVFLKTDCPVISCKKSFSTVKDLVLHIFTNHKQRSCLFCDEICSIKEQLWNHFLMHWYSGERNIDPDILATQIEYREGLTNYNPQCTHCLYKSPSFEQKHYHSWFQHGERFCSFCAGGPRTFNVEHLVCHELDHLTTILNPCVLCGGTNNQTSLEHIRDVHGFTRNPFLECRHCEERFQSYRSAMEHLNPPGKSNKFPCAGKKMYFCDKCGKQFPTHNSLSLHTHQKDTKFVCETCGLSVPNQMRMKEHMAVHSGERPYSCVICEKSFARSYNLRTHMRSHTGFKPHQCQYCKKDFTRGNNLKVHIKAMHKKGGGIAS